MRCGGYFFYIGDPVFPRIYNSNFRGEKGGTAGKNNKKRRLLYIFKLMFTENSLE